MSKAVITAVIPTYRRPAMLRRAIRSVLNQSFVDFRVCVYDNASGDETAAVVEDFRRKDSRVEYTGWPRNLGVYANWMEAAARVKTPFFSFLPDDDLLLPNFFEAALAGFRRHPQAALSILATLPMTPDGVVLDSFILHWPEGLLPAPDGMLWTVRCGNPGLQAMMIRKDVWQEMGGFDEATAPADELDFDLRVMGRYPIAVSRQPGAIQVMHSGSSTLSAGLNWCWPCGPRIIRKVETMDLPPAARQEVIERLTRWTKRVLFMRVGIQGICHGRWEEAEKAAELLEQEYGLARVAGFVRNSTAICQHLPGSRGLLRALVDLRSRVKAMRNFRLQRRFRTYAEFLRISSAEMLQP